MHQKWFVPGCKTGMLGHKNEYNNEGKTYPTIFRSPKAEKIILFHNYTL